MTDEEIVALLRRSPHSYHFSEDTLAGKNVLVTGAGGSIGAALSVRAAQLSADRIVILGRGENSLFSTWRKLLAIRDYDDVVPVVLNVLETENLQRLLDYYQIDLVFHAAAHKHVFFMEEWPIEAFRNNTIGTLSVFTAAAAYGKTERVVLVSTDKAVEPTTVMGASKRLAELLIMQFPDLPVSAVRFGNVLASRGSVYQVFRSQAMNGGPITVTSPDVKRFFMTHSEAVDALLLAATVAPTHSVLWMNMGFPVAITDLAQRIASLYAPNGVSKIVFTGLIPGEKLSESLHYQHELPNLITHSPASFAFLDDSVSLQTVEMLRSAIESGLWRRCIAITQSVIPSFSPQLDKIPVYGKIWTTTLQST